MLRKKSKKRYILNKFLIVSSILLLCTSIYFYQKNTKQEQTLKELEIRLEQRQEQEQFVQAHQQDLITIKTLKQEILGQQHKLEEYSNQIASFTKILIENQKKLSSLEQ